MNEKKREGSMFRVVGSDGNVYGLVDTKEQAEAIVEMKQLTRDGKAPSGKTDASKRTKASTLTFKIEQVPASVHPGYAR